MLIHAAVPVMIGLGLDEDLPNFHGTRVITYLNAGWQRAGLTSVDWGRAVVDRTWFFRSFKEAVQQADGIRFDVSNFSLVYPMPGITSSEFAHIVNSTTLFDKTVFIRDRDEVSWNGLDFERP